MMTLRLAAGIRSHFVTRLPEWGLSAGLLIQGFNLVRPGDSFATSPVYQLLASFVTDKEWGWVAITIAFVWLICLAINGSFRASRVWTPWLRSACSGAAGAFWSMNAFCIATIASTNPGVVNNATLGGVALAYFILIAREVGRSQVLEAQRCPTPNHLTGRL